MPNINEDDVDEDDMSIKAPLLLCANGLKRTITPLPSIFTEQSTNLHSLSDTLSTLKLHNQQTAFN